MLKFALFLWLAYPALALRYTPTTMTTRGEPRARRLQAKREKGQRSLHGYATPPLPVSPGAASHEDAIRRNSTDCGANATDGQNVGYDKHVPVNTCQMQFMAQQFATYNSGTVVEIR